jgi:CHAT domain-containing protein
MLQRFKLLSLIVGILLFSGGLAPITSVGTVTAQAQVNGTRKAEADRLLIQGFQQYNTSQFAAALQSWQQALKIYQELKDRNGEANSLIGLGVAYNTLGQYQKAIEFHQQSLAISKQIGNLSSEGTILSSLGILLAEQKQPELAIVFYKQSVNLTESLRKDIRGLPKEIQHSYTQTVADRYRYLANLLLKRGRIMEALQVLDLLKVQELEDYLKNTKGSALSAKGIGLLPPEQEFGRSSKGQLTDLQQLAIHNQQLAQKLQRISPQELNAVPESLRKLPQGAALLYPFILGDRLELVLFTPNSIPIHRSVPINQKDLEAAISTFREDLLGESSSDVKASAQKLYTWLIAPIAAELAQAKATTIIYAPDGQLRYIPLAALYDGKQWLIEKYSITNPIAYSLSDFDAKSPSKTSVLAGAFGKGDRFGQKGLPASIPEVEQIAATIPSTVKLLENAFSRKATESQMSSHNIIHFATHAEFKPGKPEDSFIIFGNGDKVLLSEVKNWNMQNVSLVVLSACQTGLGGKLGSGIEILGFGYQVQRGGAKAAIASLWKVSDRSTQVLMVNYYQRLLKGESRSEALRQAQLELLNNIQYQDPYYWAPFILIGNGL